MQDANQHPKFSITDAVALAALTVFAYVFHYFFEYGYLSYFNIPAAYISFNLPEMIPAISALVVIYLIAAFFLWPAVVAPFARTRAPGAASSSSPETPNRFHQRTWFPFFAILLAALAASIALGRIAAMTRSSFPIAGIAPECAGVYATAERFICKPYQPDKSFGSTYQLFNLAEYPTIEFRAEPLGPLHPESAHP